MYECVECVVLGCLYFLSCVVFMFGYMFVMYSICDVKLFGVLYMFLVMCRWIVMFEGCVCTCVYVYVGIVCDVGILGYVFGVYILGYIFFV